MMQCRTEFKHIVFYIAISHLIHKIMTFVMIINCGACLISMNPGVHQVSGFIMKRVNNNTANTIIIIQ